MNMTIKHFSFNPFGENCYIADDGAGNAVIVDPGTYDRNEIQELVSYLSAESLNVKAILLTHGHFDHIFGVKELASLYGVKVYMGEADRQILPANLSATKSFGMKAPDIDFPSEDVAEGDSLSFGGMSFEVISTPGHTPGGVCYYDREDKVIFTGDTLFRGSIGRSDLYGGDYDKLIVSIMDQLMGLDGDVDILPGHGPSSNIGYERTHNPFLQPFNEKEEDLLSDEDQTDGR